MSNEKIALITGCSPGGIGFYLAEEFAAAGCKVYATARRLESLNGFTHESIEKFALDVKDEEDVQRVIDTVLSVHGRIDILVNNAGTACIGASLDIPIERVRDTFETNTFAPLRLCKIVIPHMAKRRSGLIMNIGSVVGDIPTPWHGIYSASKSALHAITETLSMECRPFDVNVMLVTPGSVKSNLSDNQAPLFSLPEDTLYRDFLPQIIARMYTSQGPGSMPTDQFAKSVVKKALSSKPPVRFIEGGKIVLFTILKWLPRSLALYLVWRNMSKKP